MLHADDLDRPLPKPRDTVETPTGRLGVVMAVLPERRREVQYLNDARDTVILKADKLKVRVSVKPRRWQEKFKP